jgi:hypothetical protein
MNPIKVQYDAQTRTFKLVGDEFSIILDADGLYDLAIQLTVSDLEKGISNARYARFVSAARDRAYSARN